MTAPRPRLVGRDQPLAELRALVAAALASRGGLATLTGEAGIGKTTLATAVADHAEARGATVVWSACWEGAPPFWPWREVLAAIRAEADRLGLEELAADAAGLREDAGGGRGEAGPAEFRRASASWTLSYAGHTVRPPDAKGMRDPAERARKAVTERIRYSMARIARAHPELAGHLKASVTTGSSCAYVAAEPVTWLT